MKTRINLTVEEKVVAKAKQYAASHETTISQMVEEYLVKVIEAPSKKKSMIDILRKMPPAKEKYEGQNLSKVFYEERKKKYGF